MQKRVWPSYRSACPRIAGSAIGTIGLRSGQVNGVERASACTLSDWRRLVTFATCCGHIWIHLYDSVEQFVAKSNGAEYVRCSNWACGYFCSLDELSTHERVVQLDVDRAFRSGDAPLCEHHKPCALQVSRSVKNNSRPYFTCRERWPCTFFCWADLEVTLRQLPNQQSP